MKLTLHEYVQASADTALGVSLFTKWQDVFDEVKIAVLKSNQFSPLKTDAYSLSLFLQNGTVNNAPDFCKLICAIQDTLRVIG